MNRRDVGRTMAAGLPALKVGEPSAVQPVGAAAARRAPCKIWVD